MQQILKRIGVAVLGVVVTLAWWSFTGMEVRAMRSKESLPRFGMAAGGCLPSKSRRRRRRRFSMSFSDDDDRSMNAWTLVEPGSHNWTVNIPPGAGGYIELGAQEPKVGDKLEWKITLDGKPVEDQSETLTEPLKSGYAFFLQSYYDDYSKMEVSEDE